MEQVEVHHTKKEESVDYQQRQHTSDGNYLEGDVALRTLHLGRVGALALHLPGGQRHRTLNDAPTLHDTYDARHCNGTNAHAARITGEYVLWTHVAHSSGDCRIPLAEHCVREYDCHQGNDYPPDKHGSGTNDGRILQSDDVSKAQHGCACIDLHYQLGLVGQVLSEAYHARSDVLIPPTKGGYDEVVQATNQSGYKQRLGLRTAFTT